MQDNQTEIAEQERETLTPDAIYKNNIYALVDDVKQEAQFINKTDEELKSDKAFFPVLIDYIYNNYIGDLLGNKNHTPRIYNDIDLLDNIFTIYNRLVSMYKWNNKPSIVEFSLLTGITRNTIYTWLKGDNNINPSAPTEKGTATRRRSDIVQKWVDTCERALMDGNDTIRDIFILKAKYGWQDRNNEVNITVNHKQIVSAEDLPALLDLTGGKNG